MRVNQLMTFDTTTLSLDYKKLKAVDFDRALTELVPLMMQEHNENVELGETYFELFEDYPSHMRVHCIMTVLHNLTRVLGSASLRKISAKWTPIVDEVHTTIQLDTYAYKKFKSYTSSEEFVTLSSYEKEGVMDLLDSLEKKGVGLDDTRKSELVDLNKELCLAVEKFENNIVDAEEDVALKVTLEELDGCPRRVIETAVQLAQLNDLPEGVLVIDEISGTFSDVMMYARSETLRKQVYNLRKSMCRTVPYDNTSLAEKICELEQKRAKILGYSSYADMVIKKSMAKTPQTALDFLQDIGTRALAPAKKQMADLLAYGKDVLGRPVEFWDKSYVEEHYKTHQLHVDSEVVRQYFPVDNALGGLFALVKKLFAIDFKKGTASVWHPDVAYYDVYEDGHRIGGLYLDLFSREGKASGAWVLPLLNKDVSQGKETFPLAALCCNFSKVPNVQCTLEWDDLITLFHEMGHALHQLVTKITHVNYSGIGAVEHDAVELPSQMLENFCYHYDSLRTLSGHVHTKEELPLSLFEKIKAAKNFLGAVSVVRTTCLAEMDLLLYTHSDKKPSQVEALTREKWKLSSVYDTDNYIYPTFSHIFGGGYSAGYYAYQWAEVLAADAFAAFEEALNGGDDELLIQTAHRYKYHILESGGWGSMADKFKEFRGRDPRCDYLLKSCGI